MTHAYCPSCGAKCELLVPDGDHLERSVCTACGTVHYVNPKVVVGCIVESEERILLCRRAIEPALGRWTFPAGYLEVGETAFAGAARETKEEAEAEVEFLGLHAILDIPHIGQAYHVYRTRLVGAHFAPTPESSEVQLVTHTEIPWGDLAFPSIATALRLYVEDRARPEGPRVHTGTIHWNREGSRFDLSQYELRDHRTH